MLETREKKGEFITALMDSVRTGLLSSLDRVPADWDGHELRQWLADAFASHVYKPAMSGRRLKAYNNAVIVNNL